MEQKAFIAWEVKRLDENGSFEGMLSPYGNVDSGSDVVKSGAFTKTLKDQGPKRPMLWAHRVDLPIGELTLEETPEGLWCKGQLLMVLPEAQRAYELIKAGIVRGLSIGFEAVKDTVVGGVRYLSEIKLYEGSIVLFPMNEQALIANVKARQEKDGSVSRLLDETIAMVRQYDFRPGATR